MTLLASPPHITDGASKRLAEGSQESVKLRADAWETLQHLPVPAHQDEDWRRTDPRPFLARLDQPLADTSYLVRKSSLPTTGVHISPPGAAAGASDSVPAMVALPDSLHSRYFTTLWKALHDGGTAIDIAPGSAPEAPVEVELSSSASGSMHLPLVFIHVGAHSSLTVHLRERFSHDSALILGGTVIVLDDGATCTLIQSTSAAPDALLSGFHHIVLGRDSSFEGVLLRNGGGSSKHYLDIDLAGAGSTGILTALDLQNGDVHRDLQTLQLHRAPSTTSSFLVRNVVDDHAHSVYSGLIDVSEEAVKTDGYVQNRNLLLSRTAQADSVPRLEIKANDVKCGHGTTAGHVDHEQLFYLESRGISRETASRMIIQGFLLEGCAHMRSPEARAAAEAFVAQFAPDMSSQENPNE